MANLTPKKIDLSQINGGVEYTVADGVQPETINGVIEASAYAQALATNTPNTSLANQTGVPSVEIEEIYGTPRFVFKNLKGDSALADGVVSNAVGTSTTDTYSQALINNLISNPNLLINGDFRINQRGKTSYTTIPAYTVDRWKMWSYNGTFTPSTKTMVAGNVGGNVILSQYLEEDISETNVTLSAKINGVVYVASGNTSNTLINNFDTGYIRVIKDNNTNHFRVDIGTKPNSTNRIDYIKLEFGLIATAFFSRQYVEELVLCQRYYQKLSVTPYIYIDPDIENVFNIQKLTKMRSVGTIKNNSFFEIDSATTVSASAVFNTDGFVSFKYNNVPLLQSTVLPHKGDVEIDAEIY